MLYKFEYNSKEHQQWMINDNTNSIDIVYFKEKTEEWNWWISKHGADELITDEVNSWMKTNKIKDPFQNKEEEILLRLRFE